MAVIFLVGGIFFIMSLLGLATRKRSESTAPRNYDNTVAAAEPEKTIEVHSGDGKTKLIQTSSRLADASTSYTFKVTDGTSDSPRVLFSKKLASGETAEIPANSWSPDNKQLFIKENSGGTTNYFVYKANGSKYKNGDDYLDVSSLWQKSKNRYSIKMATGWAGNDLLELRTIKEGGTDGPSFWFVTSSRGFLQLAH